MSCLLLSFAICVSLLCQFYAFKTTAYRRSPFRIAQSVQMVSNEAATQQQQVQDPLLLRAARGEEVERAPVWMMRQAGRHMQVYRNLCKQHKTFRERSENADVATEIRYVLYKK